MPELVEGRLSEMIPVVVINAMQDDFGMGTTGSPAGSADAADANDDGMDKALQPTASQEMKDLTQVQSRT